MKHEIGGDIRLPFISSTIVAVDPGETTGFAVYDIVQQILACSSSHTAEFLIPLISILRPQVFLVERFPIGRSLSYEVEVIYQNLANISVLISPSEWKPFMKTRKRKFSKAKNTHEKDAIDMIRYYLLTHDKDDIA